MYNINTKNKFEFNLDDTDEDGEGDKRKRGRRKGGDSGKRSERKRGQGGRRKRRGEEDVLLFYEEKEGNSWIVHEHQEVYILTYIHNRHHIGRQKSLKKTEMR